MVQSLQFQLKQTHHTRSEDGDPPQTTESGGPVSGRVNSGLLEHLESRLCKSL